MEQIKKSHFWSWSIDEADLKNQVDNYHSLKITQSYRGLSILIVSALLVFSFALSLFGTYSDPTTILYALIIYAPVLFFFSKGHRWAIILLMVLWTIEKIYPLLESGGSGWLGSVIWWLIVMPYFWKALRVENERKKLAPAVTNTLGSAFCNKCGERLEASSTFCSTCGAKVPPPIMSE